MEAIAAVPWRFPHASECQPKPNQPPKQHFKSQTWDWDHPRCESCNLHTDGCLEHSSPARPISAMPMKYIPVQDQELPLHLQPSVSQLSQPRFPFLELKLCQGSLHVNCGTAPLPLPRLIIDYGACKRDCIWSRADSARSLFMLLVCQGTNRRVCFASPSPPFH